MEADPPQQEKLQQEVKEEEVKGQKELILMRGLPGSGKSFKAKKLAGDKGVVFSTDDFFMIGGKYQFDAKLLGDNHDKNYKRAVEAMKEGKPLIIIDNTNIKLWEMKKYVLAGQEHGYSIRIQQADTPWAHSYRQCAKKNSHGVPEQALKRMLQNWQDCKGPQDIKNAKSFQEMKRNR